MKRLSLLIFLIAVSALSARGQAVASHITFGSTLPITCNPLSGDVFFLTTSPVGGYQCTGVNTWTAFNGGGPPSGAAGGVLSGNYPNPSLAASISQNSVFQNGLTAGLAGCYGQQYTATGNITQWTLVRISGAGVAPASTSVGATLGVAQSTVTNGNPVTVCTSGVTQITMDGSTTADHIVTSSVVLSGYGSDSGFTAPTSLTTGQAFVGFALTSCSGSGCVSAVSLIGSYQGPSGGGGGGGSGTVTNFLTPIVPAGFTSAVTNPTTVPQFTLGLATGQTSGRVFGTCGTATILGVCPLGLTDLPGSGSITINGNVVPLGGSIVIGGGGSGGGYFTSLSATVGPPYTITVLASTHGQGTTPAAICLDSTKSVTGCAWTLNSSGDVAYTFGASFTGYTIIFNGSGTGGTVTNFQVPVVPSWLTASVANPTINPLLTMVPTTGQTSHQVIGTCGSGTTFAPCNIANSDLPGGGAITINSTSVPLGGSISVPGSAITSLSVTVPPWLTVTPSTLTASGTFTFNASTGQTVHQVVGTGSSGSVSLINLTPLDIPFGTGLSSVGGSIVVNTSIVPSISGSWSVGQCPVVTSTSPVTFIAAASCGGVGSAANGQVLYNNAGVVGGLPNGITFNGNSIPLGGTISIAASDIVNLFAGCAANFNLYGDGSCHGEVLFSALPTCNSAAAGARRAISDSTQTLAAGIGLAAAGTGTPGTHVPVFCTGAAWVVG